MQLAAIGRRNVEIDPAAFGSDVPGVDGVRAAAALMVFAFHFLGAANPSWLHGELRRWVWQLGPQGVAMFFVLSGFLLYRPFATSTLLDKPFRSVRSFYARRFVRIFPAYWLALGAAIALGLSDIHNVSAFAVAATLTQGYRRGSELIGLGVAWTLVVEVSFYLSLPLLARCLRGLAGRGANRARILQAQVIGLVALELSAVLCRSYVLWGGPFRAAPSGTWFSVFALPQSLFWHLDCFVLGIALALVSVIVEQSRRLPRGLAILVRRPGVCWVAALLCFAVACTLKLGGVGNGPATKMSHFIAVPLRGLSAALFLLPVVLPMVVPSRLIRCLRSRIARVIGLGTFGIYLWHLVIIGYTRRWFHDPRWTTNLVGRFALVALLTGCAAALSYLCIERPLMDRMRRSSLRIPEM